jgi:hypothetical protein
MKNLNAFVTVTALVALCGVSNAGLITAKYTSNLSQSAKITGPYGYNNDNVNTVAFHWTRTDAAGPGVDSTVPVTFDTYCVDLSQSVRSNTNTTYQVVSMTDAGYSVARQNLLTQLWQTYKPGIDTAAESAAFQLAVWEIIYDTNMDTNSGTFKVNSSTNLRNAAQALVTSASNLAGSPNGPANIQLVVLRSDSAQDQITAIPVVPSPGTVALAGLGLLMAAPRRKARN